MIALFTKGGDTIITGGRNDGVIKFWNRGGAEQGKLVTGRENTEERGPQPGWIDPGDRRNGRAHALGCCQAIAAIRPFAIDRGSDRRLLARRHETRGRV